MPALGFVCFSAPWCFWIPVWHAADLKSSLVKAINDILQPVRQHFEQNAEAKELLKKVGEMYASAQGVVENSPGNLILGLANAPMHLVIVSLLFFVVSTFLPSSWVQVGSYKVTK
jgi:hypothetical protein